MLILLRRAAYANTIDFAIEFMHWLFYIAFLSGTIL